MKIKNKIFKFYKKKRRRILRLLHLLDVRWVGTADLRVFFVRDAKLDLQNLPLLEAVFQRFGLEELLSE